MSSLLERLRGAIDEAHAHRRLVMLNVHDAEELAAIVELATAQHRLEAEGRRRGLLTVDEAIEGFRRLMKR